MNDELRERIKLGVGSYVTLSLRVKVYPVVEHASVEPQRDGELPWLALALSHQEASVYPGAQQELGLCSSDVTVKPRVLLETVHLGNVGGGNPPDLALDVCSLAPIAVLTLARHLELVCLLDRQLAGLVGVVAVFGYVEVWVLFLCADCVEEVLQRAPAVAVGNLGRVHVFFFCRVVVSVMIQLVVSSVRCRRGEGEGGRNDECTFNTTEPLPSSIYPSLTHTHTHTHTQPVTVIYNIALPPHVANGWSYHINSGCHLHVDISGHAVTPELKL